MEKHITGVSHMKIDKVDIEKILLMDKRGIYGQEKDEGKGFFKKLFHGKNKDAGTYYEERINEIGRDELEQELSGEIDAYRIEKSDPMTTIILTENYLILPNQDIFPLENVKKFALGAVYLPEYMQYAQDREGVPYDPEYKSEYEGEESYELDRFNIDLVLADEENAIYTYTFPMEVPDRKDFRDRLSDRCIANDLSEDLVFEGKFNEDHSISQDFLTNIFRT